MYMELLVRVSPRMRVLWVPVPPDFSLKNDCFGRVCVVLLLSFCCVVLPCLVFLNISWMIKVMYIHVVMNGFVCTCRYNDPPYVKMKKVELLTELCNVENAENIVSELG